MSTKRGHGGSSGGKGRGGGGGNECYSCGKTGHRGFECPNKRQATGGGAGRGGFKCFICGDPGHHKNDCPKGRGQSSGYSGRPEYKCFGCGQTGHSKNDCPNARGQGGYGGGGYGGGGGDRAGGSALRKPRREVEPFAAKEIVCKSKAQFVKRPDVGTKGEIIKLIANHFRLIINDIIVYHYHIEFTPTGGANGARAGAGDLLGAVGGAAGGRQPQESKNKMRKLRQKENRLVFNEFVIKNPDLFKSKKGKRIEQPVFDGTASVYTAHELSTDAFDCRLSVKLDGKPTDVKIAIKFAQKIDLSHINLYYDGKTSTQPREAQQALDIILRYGPTSNRIPIGNSLYPKWSEQNPYDNRVNIDDNGNKQVVFGHYQSTRLTKVGPTLLVDRSATAFYSGGTLISFLAKLMNSNERDLSLKEKRDIDRLKYSLKGIRIYTNHLTYKRSYTVKELSYQSAGNQSFEYTESDGKVKKTTVKEYFKKTYNKDINNDRLPCVIPQGSKEIFLPLELCFLCPDQPVPRAKLDAINTSKMVRECGNQSPAQRFDDISEAVATIKSDSQKYLLEFNIEIDDRPLLVPGRVLDKPGIQGLDRKASGRIHKPMPLDNWVFVNLVQRWVRDDNVREFIKQLTGYAADTVGLHVRDPIKIWNYDSIGGNGIKDIFVGAQEECKKRKVKLQMILFVIPEDSQVYTNIKMEGDIHQGIVTQCVKAKNVSRPPKGGVQANLLLKINAKLGGINRILKELPDKPRVLCEPNRPIMIIGADVTHPAPADRLESSVAACIGSYDKDHCVYAASIRVQEKSTRAQAVEMIKEFDVMIKDLLDVYQKERKCYPKHIIYYRDGVSESQFDQVLTHEMTKLLAGCKALGFTPILTFITVQKRHHTRFRPQDSRQGLGKKGNIPPGTTVDTHVVHPTDFDFYLCSHEGIQGTSRPTHYYVLHDDYGFKADDLQKLTYYLCYTYARCDKPISIPSPVQYAHLAAYRARTHIIACNESVGNRHRDETDEERKAREFKLAQKLNTRIKVNESVKNRMYYC